MTTTEKTCFKCGKTLPLVEFYKHKMMADGHLNKCKTCTKADVSKHRAENVERIREYDRQRANLPHRREQAKRIGERWREEHPKRRAANIAVGNAVRRGDLNPLPCFECGAEKTEAHHPDYDRPLDVIWLCPAHHKQTHAMTRST